LGEKFKKKKGVFTQGQVNDVGKTTTVNWNKGSPMEGGGGMFGCWRSLTEGWGKNQGDGGAVGIGEGLGGPTQNKC